MSKKEFKAQIELDRAEEKLINSLSKEQEELLKNSRKINGVVDQLISLKYKDFSQLKGDAAFIYVMDSSVNMLIDNTSGESKIKQAVRLLVDGAIAYASFYIPLFGIVTTILSLKDIDPSTGYKELYSYLFESKKSDVFITPNGFLRVTMPDGTVYMRPASEKLKSLYGISKESSGMLSGGQKSDVLFGGSEKDIFIGHGGNDLFIGGDGKDDYFVNNSFITIKDSDGKGRVFDNNYKQLRGGTYSYSKNGEDKYFDGDTAYLLNKSTKTLHISK